MNRGDFGGFININDVNVPIYEKLVLLKMLKKLAGNRLSIVARRGYIRHLVIGYHRKEVLTINGKMVMQNQGSIFR